MEYDAATRRQPGVSSGSVFTPQLVGDGRPRALTVAPGLGRHRGRDDYPRFRQRHTILASHSDVWSVTCVGPSSAASMTFPASSLRRPSVGAGAQSVIWLMGGIHRAATLENRLGDGLPLGRSEPAYAARHDHSGMADTRT